jgi:hypothetical protein
VFGGVASHLALDGSGAALAAAGPALDPKDLWLQALMKGKTLLMGNRAGGEDLCLTGGPYTPAPSGRRSWGASVTPEDAAAVRRLGDLLYELVNESGQLGPDDEENRVRPALPPSPPKSSSKRPCRRETAWTLRPRPASSRTRWMPVGPVAPMTAIRFGWKVTRLS